MRENNSFVQYGHLFSEGLYSLNTLKPVFCRQAVMQLQ